MEDRSPPKPGVLLLLKSKRGRRLPRLKYSFRKRESFRRPGGSVLTAQGHGAQSRAHVSSQVMPSALATLILIKRFHQNQNQNQNWPVRKDKTQSGSNKMKTSIQFSNFIFNFTQEYKKNWLLPIFKSETSELIMFQFGKSFKYILDVWWVQDSLVSSTEVYL